MASPRIDSRFGDILNLVQDGNWRTLEEAREALGYKSVECAPYLRHNVCLLVAISVLEGEQDYGQWKFRLKPGIDTSSWSAPGWKQTTQQDVKPSVDYDKVAQLQTRVDSLNELLGETRISRDQLAGEARDLRQKIEELESRPAPDATEIVIVNGAQHTRVSIDGKHAAFCKVLKLCCARRNVLLIGPAGTGKTHLAEQVAEAMELPFRHISCSAGMSEGQLLGRLLPTGEAGKFEYIISDFVKTYEEGGVFLFDEIDAADSNTMLVVNSALANGCLGVPNRPGNTVAKKHPNFVCIAAANTFGTGADRQYVGRNQMDESTLDRFRIGQIEVDYDDGMPRIKSRIVPPSIPEEFSQPRRGAKGIEPSLCPDDNLRIRLQFYRHKVQESKLRRIVSMRFLRDAYIMKEAGFTDADVDNALFAGWTPDEMQKVGVKK